jgi:hypothetical protein
MADNIAAAFHALHERWEAIFAREQGRLAAMQQDLPQALREMAYATALRETESPTYQAYEQELRDRVDTVEALDGAAWEPDPLLDHRYQSGAGREVGYDGLDDVRIPREEGPALGSLEAAQAEHTLEEHRAREVDEANPTVLDRVEQLQQRLEAMTTAALALARHQDRDQGMGY